MTADAPRYMVDGEEPSCSLAELLDANSDPPLAPGDVAAIEALGAGETAHLDIGGGAVPVQRVS